MPGSLTAYWILGSFLQRNDYYQPILQIGKPGLRMVRVVQVQRERPSKTYTLVMEGGKKGPYRQEKSQDSHGFGRPVAFCPLGMGVWELKLHIPELCCKSKEPVTASDHVAPPQND